MGAVMKYMVTWDDRPMGSATEYENSHKRLLSVFGQWKAPASFSILAFVVRIGEVGGYMLVETDNPLDIHRFANTFSMIEFKVHPVADVGPAVSVELEAMAWRDSLPN
jgi:hypothetical protein